MNIFKEFRNIAGFKLSSRETNYRSERIERKDSLFHQLTTLYFFQRKRFRKLYERIEIWVKNDPSETILALAGYLYYIEENFKRAKQYFLKLVSVNPDNLDSWIDLAFLLRHAREYDASESIILNLNYVVYYYKYFKLDACDYTKFKNLLLKIKKHAL